MSATWFAAGAVSAAIGVALGAFGAHGLKSRVGPDLLGVWETGVRYHLVHALGLLAIGWVLAVTCMARGACAALWFRRGRWKERSL